MKSENEYESEGGSKYGSNIRHERTWFFVLLHIAFVEHQRHHLHPWDVDVA